MDLKKFDDLCHGVLGLEPEYRETQWRGSSIRQWTREERNFAIRITEWNCVRKITFKGNGQRAVMHDFAYWITDSQKTEYQWKREPDDGLAAFITLVLS